MIKGESSRPATSRKEAHEQLKKSLQDNIDSGYYEDGEKIEIFTPKQYKESKYFKKGYAKGGEIDMKEEKIKELEELKEFLKTATDKEDIEQAKLSIAELENEIMYNYEKGGKTNTYEGGGEISKGDKEIAELKKHPFLRLRKGDIRRRNINIKIGELEWAKENALSGSDAYNKFNEYAKGGTIRKGDYVEDYGDIGLVNKTSRGVAYVKFDDNSNFQPVQISELKKKGTHKGKDLYILP